VPRDEVVTSIGNDDDKKPNDDIVLDLSELTPDEITEIDTGVTSGADSSDWDPINIDEEKANKCAGAGSASASTKGSPAACGVKQK
ncbi:MAG: hypothetical protein HOP91_00255, partial [Sphingomonas sp.]|nr:hypothetical protein [Sphingomonas sp.]